jgi:LysM repeat protein/N-acetylmuramoyl-L-alanine amidase
MAQSVGRLEVKQAKQYPGYLRRSKSRSPKKKFIYAFVLLSIAAYVISAAPVSHEVTGSDTLYSLSRTYGVSVSQIRLANQIDENNTIRVGQKLVIPLHYYIVEAGDTVLSIAHKLGTEERKIIQLNRLEPTKRIKAGDTLIIPQKPVEGQTYVVQKGDTLSYVSLRFDIAQTLLVKLNDLDSHQLKEGQVLQLTSRRPQNYTVTANDTLYSIAAKFNVTVDQLMQYNALNSTDIYPGQELTMFSPAYDIFEDDIWRRPEARTQQVQLAAAPALQYERPSPLSARESRREERPLPESVEERYQAGLKLINRYNKEIDAMGRLSNRLAGYHIVLDAGHGGRDPGAVVRKTLNGQARYFVEDEYNYDVVMRLYALLRRHGATVSLTTLSPEHTVRDNDINETFDNNKTEIFNDEKENEAMGGGGWVLRRRLEIARKIFAKTARDKRIFVSVHMDSSENTPLGLVAVANNASKETLALAKAIIESSGRGTVIEGGYIIVNNNPSPAAVLVEVRNLMQEDAAIINNHKIRQRDAEKIADGIINYVAAQ